MASILSVNPKAEIARSAEALSINVVAANGLADFVRSNLGPKGTLKMLVSGAGDIKLSKDGKVLLSEIQVKHPTASLICRAATSQDEFTGDGTTSVVMLIGELLVQAHQRVLEGLHPRIVIDGFLACRERSLQFLDKMAVRQEMDRDILLEVARTSLRTKLRLDIADTVSDVVTDAVLCIRQPNLPIDLHMVEIMEMPHKMESDTKLVRGIVMDHGARHPDMPKRLKDCFILTCNIGLEYEKTEINAGFYYSSPAEREKMVAAEQQFVVDRCEKIIELKKKVCQQGQGFVVVNQKGIDPNSLDMLAKENIFALRRAKRRNMERLTLACGGEAVNSLDDLSADVLGRAGLVYEYVLGEDKFTFVEECATPRSCTVLIKGPNKHSLQQIKEALRDGLRAVMNAIEDGCVVPGAGAFEVALCDELKKFKDDDAIVKGRRKLGVEAYADALLTIPKTLARNAGYDPMEVLVKLEQEYKRSKQPVGIDLETGEPISPADIGIWDNYRVKKQLIESCTSIAVNLLMVDELMRAGMSSLKG